jgi:iron complex outermembrane receptor protein
MYRPASAGRLSACLLLSAAATAALSLYDPAHAETDSADWPRFRTVAPVTVVAQPGSLTQPGVALQRAEVLSTAGSVGFIDAETLKGRHLDSLRDVLKDAPGVFVETRYGQELRLSVRGSGMARGYHLRGIEVLQDGIPWNLADGSGDVYEIDPLSLRSVAIYKGGNGLQFGSATLGGAINFVTPTARTAIAPGALRVEGGSFGSFRASAVASRADGAWDALATLTYNTAEGARAHSRSRDVYLNANLGYRFNDRAETRLYLSVDDTRQQLPGALTLAQALVDPGQAAYASAAPIAGGDQQRNDKVQRLADRTTLRLGDGRLDLDLWAYHKSLVHPIFQVLDQDGWTWGGGLRYVVRSELSGHANELILGGRAVAGLNHARQYLNLAGRRAGGPTADADQKALNLEAYVEDRFHLTPTLTFSAGGKLIADRRRLADKLAPARSGDKTFRGFDPRIGLLWQATPSAQLFADITRSRDVPDFTDLSQVNTAGASFTPLRAQRAWTYEAGARGAYGPIRFDVTLYRAEIRGELLQYTVDPSIPATTFNARRTLHQGVEAAVAVDVVGDADAPQAGDVLTLSALWNLNDFRFRGDPQYGGGRIAGTPRNVLRFEARYERPTLFGARKAYLEPQVDWVPQGAYADQMNTVRTPGYVLLGLEAGFELGERMLVYLEARNLTDEAYVSDISTVVSAAPASAIYYPGDRRSVFAGVRLAF